MNFNLSVPPQLIEVAPFILASLTRANPPPLARVESNAVVDRVLEALIGTTKVRLGPAPTGDNLTATRAVVEKLVARGEPIRLLMPWGSKKPDNGGLDVAELAAIRTLQDLEARVSAAYSPGIDLVMRIEDLSGDFLFSAEEDAVVALPASRRYVEDFSMLLRLLAVPFIRPFRERELMEEADYLVLAEHLTGFVHDYLVESEGCWEDATELNSYRALHAQGWTGFIPTEQREFYRSRYIRKDPDLGWSGATRLLARYFASILARIKMGGYGSERWGRDFINISFAPPVPGTPPAFASRRLFYRTVSEAMSRTHIPPWRARGFLKVTRDRVLTKIGHFGDERDWNDAVVIVEEGDARVELRAPVVRDV